MPGMATKAGILDSTKERISANATVRESAVRRLVLFLIRPPYDTKSTASSDSPTMVTLNLLGRQMMD